jgi:hypothetical protein
VARPVADIISAIETFEPANGDWLPLDALLEELFESGSAGQGIDAMLGIFERYPSEDGTGVFWAVVHGLESLPGYEDRLIESITKAPSPFPLLMVHRLLNSGHEEIGDRNLLVLLEQVAGDEKVSPATRLKAQKYLIRHRGS